MEIIDLNIFLRKFSDFMSYFKKKKKTLFKNKLI